MEPMATVKGSGTGPMGRLVDAEQGLISREIFVSEEIYAQEQERVFARVWLLVGHESQIPKPGDYFIGRMGEESVIMARDRAGEIHVFLNSCRHRGMKVCRYDEGNTPVFTCPYHGWSYGLDGSLVGVPYFKEAYHSELKKDEWGLVEVAQMANYKGTIWATWDKTAPSFEAYLGDMALYLDGLLDARDGTPGGSMTVAGVQRWILPSNWKFASENFQGDMYHGISHRSVELIGIGPGGGGQTRQGGTRATSRGITSFPGLGHGARGNPPSTEERYPFPEFFEAQGPLDDMKVIQEYYEHVYEARKKNVGDRPVTWVGGQVWPNTSYHAMFPRTLAVWHPNGPQSTEGWRWLLVDRDAPKEVVDLARHHFIRYSGPAGLTEQDDMENWNYASAASKGTIARRYPYNYKLGLGYSHESAGLTGAVTSESTISEENARTFYARWAEIMDAATWADAAPNNAGRSKR